jgi:hypothetical protein
MSSREMTHQVGSGSLLSDPEGVTFNETLNVAFQNI